MREDLLQHVSRVVYRGSRCTTGAMVRTGYDAPDHSYGVLYLGLTLPTALMESVFHKHQWDLDHKR